MNRDCIADSLLVPTMLHVLGEETGSNKSANAGLSNRSAHRCCPTGENKDKHLHDDSVFTKALQP
jgi:hypothetical protein